MFVRALWVLSIAVLIASASCSEQPGREVSAKIVDIAPRASRWHTDQVLVTARTNDGFTGNKVVDAARLTCRVGDRVKAAEVGVSLTLDSGACEQ